jgi:hypothetical protein
MIEDKVPISERALMQRITRKLKYENQMLKKSRGRLVHSLDQHYIVDTYLNSIVSSRCADPEVLGRELKVLAPWEKMIVK